MITNALANTYELKLFLNHFLKQQNYLKQHFVIFV